MSHLIKSLVVTLSLLLSTTVFAANTSYYGSKFHGKRTASGSIFNMNSLTAAHRTLPFGTKVSSDQPKNKKKCRGQKSQTEAPIFEAVFLIYRKLLLVKSIASFVRPQ